MSASKSIAVEKAAVHLHLYQVTETFKDGPPLHLRFFEILQGWRSTKLTDEQACSHVRELFANNKPLLDSFENIVGSESSRKYMLKVFDKD